MSNTAAASPTLCPEPPISDLARSGSGRIWLLLSFVLPVAFGTVAMVDGFGAYAISDDARTYVGWLQDYVEQGLFSGNYISEYIHDISPMGFRALYWVMAQVGVNPVALAKVVPLVVAVIASAYCFALTMQFLPSPRAAFLSTALLNAAIWRFNDVISGTPRAFLLPLLLAFLYYLVRRSVLGVVMVTGLAGLFYPQLLVLIGGLLVIRLVRWEGLRPRLTPDRLQWVISASALGVAALITLRYAVAVSEHGPVVTRAEAKKMPEFQPGGRTEFFGLSFTETYLFRKRSGLVPSLPRVHVLGALLLPALLLWVGHFPLARKVRPQAKILLELLVVSLGAWALAHLLLYRLYLPGRHMENSATVFISVTAGIAFAIIIDALIREARNRPGRPWPLRGAAASAAALLCLGIALYPIITRVVIRDESLSSNSYVFGQEERLYQFLDGQPKNSLVASVSEEANNIPTFAKQPVLVAREFAVTYEVGYYRRFRQRVEAVLRAQYADDLTPARNLVRDHGVDFFVIDRKAFSQGYFDEPKLSWLRAYAPARAAERRLEQGARPAMPTALRRCAVLETVTVIVARASCVAGDG